MSRLIDLTNQRFGKLLVIKRVEDHISIKGVHCPQWLCNCDCGNTTTVMGKELREGTTKSCGCYARELSSNRLKTHGLTNHRTYSILAKIHERCCNKNDKRYKDYGGRGIKLYDKWNKDVVGSIKAMKNFYSWSIANGYTDKLSIDRKDNNKGYYPFNCRWADCIVQANNKRNNHMLTYKGETLTMPEMARKYNLNYSTFKRRIYRGWNIEKAILEPVAQPIKKII